MEAAARPAVQRPIGLADPLTHTLIGLTFVTGIVDAVAFLGLGEVFAGMQTGNVLFLGFGIAGAGGAELGAPLIAIGAFLAGGSVATVVGRRLGPAHPRVLLAAIAPEVALLALAALAAAAFTIEPRAGSGYALVAVLCFAMGLRNTVARQAANPNLASTVLNLTVTAIGSHTPMSLAAGEDLAQRVAGFLSILLGALCGALLLEASVALALGVAAAVACAAGLLHISRTGLP